MYCGTKIPVKENMSSSVSHDAARLENLTALGLKSIPLGTPSDLQIVSSKILEIDSDNWFGWYLRGISAAKDAQCYVMYDAWEKALETIPPEKYEELRSEFIYYAALSSIGFGINNPKNGVPVDFLCKVNDLDPEGATHFAVSVIDQMCTMKDFLTKDTALNAQVNACQITYAVLRVYPDLVNFCDCCESLKNFDKILRSTMGVFGDLASMIYYGILPYSMLDEYLDTHEYEEDEIDNAIDYWLEHDMNEYIKYFDEAEEIADKTSCASSITAANNKRKMKKLIDLMMETYMIHP